MSSKWESFEVFMINTHINSGIYSLSFREHRILWMTGGETPRPAGGPAKIDAAAAKEAGEKKIKMTEAGTEGADRNPRDVVGKLVESTDKALQGPTKALTQQQLPQNSANAAADAKLLADPNFQKRRAAFMKNVRGIQGGEEFAETYETFSPSTQNLIAVIGSVLLMFHSMQNARRLGTAPQYGSNAPSDTGPPEKRFAALEKQMKVTDDAVASASASRKLLSVPTDAAPDFSPADAKTVAAARKNVDDELKSANSLLNLPEAQRKALTDVQQKRLQSRVEQLKKMSQELDGFAKGSATPPSPETMKKEVDAKRKIVGEAMEKGLPDLQKMLQEISGKKEMGVKAEAATRMLDPARVKSLGEIAQNYALRGQNPRVTDLPVLLATFQDLQTIGGEPAEPVIKAVSELVLTGGGPDALKKIMEGKDKFAGLQAAVAKLSGATQEAVKGMGEPDGARKVLEAVTKEAPILALLGDESSQKRLEEVTIKAQEALKILGEGNAKAVAGPFADAEAQDKVVKALEEQQKVLGAMPRLPGGGAKALEEHLTKITKQIEGLRPMV